MVGAVAGGEVGACLGACLTESMKLSVTASSLMEDSLTPLWRGEGCEIGRAGTARMKKGRLEGQEDMDKPNKTSECHLPPHLHCCEFDSSEFKRARGPHCAFKNPFEAVAWGVRKRPAHSAPFRPQPRLQARDGVVPKGRVIVQSTNRKRRKEEKDWID